MSQLPVYTAPSGSFSDTTVSSSLSSPTRTAAPAMPTPFGVASSPSPLMVEPLYLGTPVITDTVPLCLPGYNPTKDVERIYEATHGAGTNNAKMIKAFVGRTSKEIQVLQVAYKNTTQKDLIARVRDETSKVFQVGMVLLASGAVGGDASLIQVAKNEDKTTRLALLTDLIMGRPKEELDILRTFIHSTRLDSLDGMVLDSIPSKIPLVRDLFKQALEVSARDAQYNLQSDFDTLQTAIGTVAHEAFTNTVLDRILDRPVSHIHQLDRMWRQTHFNKPLAESIFLYFGNKPEAAEIIRYIINASEIKDGRYDYGILRDAERINEALLTKNQLLITTRLIRAHWDARRFKQIVAVVDGLRPKDGTTRQRTLEIVSPVFSRPLHKLLERIIDTTASS